MGAPAVGRTAPTQRRGRVDAVPAPTKPPRIALAELPELVSADGDSLLARDERDRQRYGGADLTGHDLTGSTFAECEFLAVTLDDTELRGTRFVESRIVDSFAPTLRAARTTWRDVLVENPRWGSAELFEADVTTLHVHGGKIDYLNLRTSRLTDVLIEDCTITDLDFGGCRGTRVSLRNCRVETLDVTRATLVDVDLRTTTFATVNGLEGLRGVTIDDYQLSLFAPLLATHLGIRVD